MEYMEEGTLYNLTQGLRRTARRDVGTGKFQQGWSEEEIRPIVAQIAMALEACHKYYDHETQEYQTILHHDIKLGNILMDDKKRIKLADFGCATLLSSGSTVWANDRSGTTFYMAPEQIGKWRESSTASDCWSFGCVLYELCTLERYVDPSGDLDGRSMEKYDDVYERLASVPLVLPQACSPWLIQLVRSLLSFDPSQRPSASQILAMPEMQVEVAILDAQKEIEWQDAMIAQMEQDSVSFDRRLDALDDDDAQYNACKKQADQLEQHLVSYSAFLDQCEKDSMLMHSEKLMHDHGSQPASAMPQLPVAGTYSPWAGQMEPSSSAMDSTDPMSSLSEADLVLSARL